ncbi:MAG: glycosyltransferase [Jatrophihabitantaceae bacterium]
MIGIPVYGRLDLAERAVRALDRSTPVEVELVLIDDCGPQRLAEESIAGWLATGRRWRLVSHQTNVGFVGTVNELFELAGDRDVLVLNSDVEVLPGWFEGLADAIGSRDQVASASALATEGSLLSVPELAAVPAEDERLASVRAAVPAAAAIPVAVAHCTWFDRAAIEQVGPFDRHFDPGYGEEVDWSLRAAQHGLIHLAALHSFVRHEGGASFGDQQGRWTLARRHELRLLLRYPLRWWRIRRFAADQNTPFAQAMRQIRALLAPR